MDEDLLALSYFLLKKRKKRKAIQYIGVKKES